MWGTCPSSLTNTLRLGETLEAQRIMLNLCPLTSSTMDMDIPGEPCYITASNLEVQHYCGHSLAQGNDKHTL